MGPILLVLSIIPLVGVADKRAAERLRECARDADKGASETADRALSELARSGVDLRRST